MITKSCRIALTGFLVVLVSIAAFASGPVTADLNSGLTPTDLANTLVGPASGITISAVTFTGSNIAAGTFANGMSSVLFPDGIILASGNIADVAGPNDADGTTTNLLQPGDADLNALIPGYVTFDATILEFDFVPSAGQVAFQYVFTSEEYNEYVNSAYNDVFGFFINGVNYARLIDGTVVSINNVNNGNPYGSGGSHPAFYRNNDLQDGGGSIDIEADGLTVVLTLTAPVNVGVTNHMKLAIADAGDEVLDSWVFIKGGSLTIVEDCDNGLDDDGDGFIDNGDTDCHVCGDGDVDPGEACDDGNIDAGDGCSATCTLENDAPACDSAYADPGVLWTPNHTFWPVSILGVTDANGDPIVITVTSIEQDEPVRGGRGAGNTAPDGRLLPLAVRAERQGGGDGRMYFIGFTASDGLETCSGEVRICVPHDQRPGGGCVDSGVRYDSLQP